MTGAERFRVSRRAAYVPPVATDVPAIGEHVDRHLSMLIADPGPDAARLSQGAAQAAQLLREVSPGRGPARPQHRRISLTAPLRSFKRWLGW